MSSQTTSYAVLTGDIVESSALSASTLDETLQTLELGGSAISTWAPGPYGFARRGGDAWQMALSSPNLALRAGLYLQANLRRLDKTRSTRIAIATGTGTLPASGDTNAAHGSAFTASGRLLEQLPSHILMSHAAGGTAAAALHLADHIAQGWTQAQARALCEMLPPDPGPRSAAAKRLGISRQAVDQALWAAGYPAIEAALNAWEHAE